MSYFLPCSLAHCTPLLGGPQRHPKASVYQGIPLLPPHGKEFLTEPVNGTVILSVTRLKTLTNVLVNSSLSLHEYVPGAIQTSISFLHPSSLFCCHLPVSVLLCSFFFWMIFTASYRGCQLPLVSLRRWVQVHFLVQALIKSLPSTQSGSPRPED